MGASDVYTELMQRLNYPKSEYLLRLLQKLTTPEEGQLLLELPAEPVELVQKSGLDEETVQRKLREFVERGLVVTTSKGLQFVRSVGQLHDANLCSADKWLDTELLDLWKEFYEVEWMQRLARAPSESRMHYITVVPAWKAIERSPHISLSEVLPDENIRKVIAKADPIAVVPCSCRRGMRRCDATLSNCLQFNRGAEYAIERGNGRRISAEEAIAIADEAEEEGLIHAWPFPPRLNAICNCCRDCCHVFDPGLRFGTIGQMLQKSRFRAHIDQDLCSGCQDCVERCFFEAIEMKQSPPAKKLKASIDEAKCFGCGLCPIVCDPGAITMKLDQA